jgi:hypothetical protein
MGERAQGACVAAWAGGEGVVRKELSVAGMVFLKVLGEGAAAEEHLTAAGRRAGDGGGVRVVLQ